MTVGELVAYLRLDDGQFNRGLDQAHSRIGRVGGAIGTAVKRGAVVAGAAITGLIGMTLVKGFGRLTAIENAKASLTGLGHSAEEVKGIMVDALKSVKGTAFGLDEAAGIAASAVASGIKPGQQLYSTLRLVADAATIGQSSMSEMGQVFLKVAASNKMQGDVINQLNERHIPIQQFLAKSLGVTIDKVYELSTAGKISFPIFAKAMKEGLGGSALASGNTTLGAWKNMMAALSRFGADVLSGIFPSFKVAFNRVGDYLDKLAKKYSPIFQKWGEKVSAGFKTGGFTGMFKAMLPAGVGDTLITTFGIIKDTTVTIVTVLGTIGKAFGKLPDALQKFAITAGVLAIALGKFGLLGSAKGLFGGLLGKVGGGAATEVPLTTAVGLNTAATEANTLALMGKGGLPGGGKTPLPLGSPGGTKPGAPGGTTPSGGGLLSNIGKILAVVGIGVEGGVLLKGTDADYNVAMDKMAAAAGGGGKKAAAAFAAAFASGITPASMSQHGGLLSGLDPAILRTREKLATLRQELAKKNKLGDTNTASTTAAIKRVEKHLADLRANAAKPAHTGRLNTAGWTGPISAAMQSLLEFRDLSSQGITPGSVSQHKSWTKTHPAPLPVWHAPGRAGGGNVSGPSSGYPVIMHGEETVVAHNNPSHGLADLAAAGIGGGTHFHFHVGQIIGTDERAARQLWNTVKPIAMSEMRMKGAMSRG